MVDTALNIIPVFQKTGIKFDIPLENPPSVSPLRFHVMICPHWRTHASRTVLYVLGSEALPDKSMTTPDKSISSSDKSMEVYNFTWKSMPSS